MKLTREDIITLHLIAGVMGLVVFLFLVLTPDSHADPAPDPHFPNTNQGWCPGSGVGSPLNFGLGWCDGVHYPDGSYWHQVRGYGYISLSCVVDPDNGPFPQPAPRGGCAGGAP